MFAGMHDRLARVEGQAAVPIGGQDWRLERWVIGVLLGAAVLGILLLGANLYHFVVDEPHEPTHPVFSSRWWNGDRDRSAIELFSNLQLLAAAAVLVLVFRRTRTGVYAAWAVLLAVVVADDLFTLHETVARAIWTRIDLPPVLGLPPGPLAELMVWAVLVPALGAMLLLAHRKAPAAARRDSWLLLILAAALALFVVGVDAVHVIVEPAIPPLVDSALNLLETAGELFAMTAILWGAIVILRRTSTARAGRERSGATKAS